MISTPYYRHPRHRVKPLGLRFEVQGALVVAHGTSPGSGDEEHIFGLRSSVSEFSSASRRRLQQVFCSLGSRVMLDSWFCSLTWDDSCLPDGKEVKRCLDVLSKRLLRAYPSMCVIWKVEVQDRKSGEFLGRSVPHVHLVVVSHMDASLGDFSDWLRVAWHAVVKSENPDHLGLPGCEVVKAYGSLRSVSWYVSKYTSKTVNSDLVKSFGWIGRWWGILNRSCLPVAEKQEVFLEGEILVQFNRLVRSWLSRWKSGKRYARRLSRQSQSIGFCLMGIPSEQVGRMLYHATELARGLPAGGLPSVDYRENVSGVGSSHFVVNSSIVGGVGNG